MKIKVLYSCIIAALFCSIALNAQPQLEQWSIPPRLLKIDASSNTSSIMLPTWTSGSPNASNAAFDLAGNLLFYVTDLEIYDPSGNSIGSLWGGFLPDTKEIAIFKVPGECHRHYVVYPTFGSLHYSVIEDSPSGVSVVPGKDNVDCTGAGVFSFDIQIAVSRLRADGKRFLYAAGAENLCKYVVTNQGITFNHEMLNTNAGPGLGINFAANEMDLSHDGKKLAWGNWNTATQCDCNINVVKLNANGNYSSLQTYLLPTAGMDVVGSEFDATGNYLYVGCKRLWGGPGPGPNCPNAGINKIDLSLPATSFLNISADANSHLEMARDGKIYVANLSLSGLGALDLSTDIFTPNAITIACGKTLPDQVDGEDYQAEYGSPDFWIHDGVGWPASPGATPPVDNGMEPFPVKIEAAEIWNCENDPNCMANENPEYKLFGDNYFRVKIRNRGCSTSAPSTADLHMYWTRARTNEIWDDHWIESPSNQIFGHKAGGEITIDGAGASLPLDIPSIPPGGDVILTKAWHAPDPAWYAGDGNYFDGTLRPMICFLGRVESSIDPMYNESFGSVGPNVQNNNNIGTINTYMVNLDPNNIHHWGGSIDVSLHQDQAGLVNLDFEAMPLDESFGEFGVVEFQLNPELWEAWLASGAQAENMEIVDFEKRKVRVNNPEYGSFRNLALSHDRTYNIAPGFFRNEGITGEHDFVFRLNMVDVETAETGSGCTYKVHLGDECKINLQNQFSTTRGNCVTIGEESGCSDCIYSWTPTVGLEAPTSPVTNACPDRTTTYHLTVVNAATGCEVSEDVTVYVNEGNGNRTSKPSVLAPSSSSIAEIKLFPNPANEQFQIRFVVSEAISLPFLLINNLGQTVFSHTLLAGKGENTYNFEVSHLPQGLYQIRIGKDANWTSSIAIEH